MQAACVDTVVVKGYAKGPEAVWVCSNVVVCGCGIHAGCTFSLPPVPSRGLRGPSRFGGPGRPMSPASFKNPFKTGGDGDQPHAFDSRNPRHCPTVSRLK
jgi:hypothetical protein